MKRMRQVLWGGLIMAAACVVAVHTKFNRDLESAAALAAQGSAMVTTRCGPFEVQVAGEGITMLMIHGSGGGHDQGMDWARPLTRDGIRVIAMSRFGYPTALRPSQGTRWAAVAGQSAQVTLADGATGISLLIRFDRRTDLIDSVRAEARGRTVGAEVVATPREGHWSDYAEHDGMMVPMRGEAAWLTPEGRRTYRRGTVTALAYEFAR